MGNSTPAPSFIRAVGDVPPLSVLIPSTEGFEILWQQIQNRVVPPPSSGGGGLQLGEDGGGPVREERRQWAFAGCPRPASSSAESSCGGSSPSCWAETSTLSTPPPFHGADFLASAIDGVDFHEKEE
ncbi:hypothetical protein L484_026489 [Morus notabilis]|uniref:Uncharacterized protein n=1 Tax=Morus notabilis TaxID=981085 RepID=W9QZ05_9ROSA|nr:hypothetical protein L484_026489 [Morus notabilis]